MLPGKRAVRGSGQIQDRNGVFRAWFAISDGDPSIFLRCYLPTSFAVVAVALLIAGLWPKKRAPNKITSP